MNRKEMKSEILRIFKDDNLIVGTFLQLCNNFPENEYNDRMIEIFYNACMEDFYSKKEE